MITNIIKEIVSDKTGYEIGKKIGVHPNQINRLKRGDRKIENISLELAEKILNEYANVEITIK